MSSSSDLRNRLKNVFISPPMLDFIKSDSIVTKDLSPPPDNAAPVALFDWLLNEKQPQSYLLIGLPLHESAHAS